MGSFDLKQSPLTVLLCFFLLRLLLRVWSERFHGAPMAELLTFVFYFVGSKSREAKGE